MKIDQPIKMRVWSCWEEVSGKEMVGCSFTCRGRNSAPSDTFESKYTMILESKDGSVVFPASRQDTLSLRWDPNQNW